MAILPEEQSEETYNALFKELEIYLEEDGFYCERCYSKVGNLSCIPDKHDCIECSECGEVNSCICDELRVQRIINHVFDVVEAKYGKSD